jgi:hypothetical protein
MTPAARDSVRRRLAVRAPTAGAAAGLGGFLGGEPLLSKRTNFIWFRKQMIAGMLVGNPEKSMDF